MNPLGLLKLGVDVVVSAGVGTIIGNTIKASTPTDLKLVQKITIAIGSVVLSGAVGNFAANATNDQIDQTVDQVKEIKKVFRKG